MGGAAGRERRKGTFVSGKETGEKPMRIHTTSNHSKEPPTYSAGLIIRQKEPTNLETPFDQLDSYLTPTELFYIRSHFPAPSIDVASYQLRIDGAVRSPLAMSYKE